MSQEFENIKKDLQDKLELAKAVVKDVMEKDLAYAQSQCDAHGLVWRISSYDGKHNILTRDYSPTRLNFVIVGGIIKNVNLG